MSVQGTSDCALAAHPAIAALKLGIYEFRMCSSNVVAVDIVHG